MSRQTVVDCMGPYIPRQIEAALRAGMLIRQPGKSGEAKQKGKLFKPRLKHRPDGRKYVSQEQDAQGKYVAWSEGEIGKGHIVHPHYVNPNKGEAAGLHIAIDVLWALFPESALNGIVGVFNAEPITNYRNLHLHLVSGEDCPISDSCEFAGKFCHCIWLPNQLLAWGRIADDGQFVALKEVIRSRLIDLWEFKDLIRERMNIDDWIEFRSIVPRKYEDMVPPATVGEDRVNVVLEKIAAHKLISNMQTMQRTNFETHNCYGAPFHQFGLAIETCFKDDINVPHIGMAINLRDPVVENKRQAIARLKIEDQAKQLAVKKQVPPPSKMKEGANDEMIDEAEVVLSNEIYDDSLIDEIGVEEEYVFDDDDYQDF